MAGQVRNVFFNFKHSIYQLLQILSKAHSMPILFKSIIQPRPKRCMHFQNITGKTYVGIHVLLGMVCALIILQGLRKMKKASRILRMRSKNYLCMYLYCITLLGLKQFIQLYFQFRVHDGSCLPAFWFAISFYREYITNLHISQRRLICWTLVLRCWTWYASRRSPRRVFCTISHLT